MAVGASSGYRWGSLGGVPLLSVLLVLLSAAALATPVRLPQGADPAAWEGALRLGGLEVQDSLGAPPWIALEDQGEVWRVRTCDADGVVREGTVAEPETEAEREAVVWLATSLLEGSPDAETRAPLSVPPPPSPPAETPVETPARVKPPVEAPPEVSPEVASSPPEAPPLEAPPPEVDPPAPPAEAPSASAPAERVLPPIPEAVHQLDDPPPTAPPRWWLEGGADLSAAPFPVLGPRLDLGTGLYLGAARMGRVGLRLDALPVARLPEQPTARRQHVLALAAIASWGPPPLPWLRASAGLSLAHRWYTDDARVVARMWTPQALVGLGGAWPATARWSLEPRLELAVDLRGTRLTVEGVSSEQLTPWRLALGLTVHRAMK